MFVDNQMLLLLNQILQSGRKFLFLLNPDVLYQSYRMPDGTAWQLPWGWDGIHLLKRGDAKMARRVVDLVAYHEAFDD